MRRVSIGRREFLALSASSLLAGQNGRGETISFPPQHFLDGATELDLYRLTDPQTTAWLPAPHLHFISRRNRFLVHTSDRSGNPQAYRLDWHTGEARQITSAQELDPLTPAISFDDRLMFYFDGRALKQVVLSNLRERQIADVESGWERTPGFSLALDGSAAVWIERQASRTRIRSARTARGGVSTVIETPDPVTDPQLRQGRAQLAYRRGDSVRLIGLDGKADSALRTEPGSRVGQMQWSPDGTALFYLAMPSDPTQLTAIREYTPESGADRLIAKTSQFAAFGINGDASVFVGASRSLASPYILLLLRVTRRELTLCEHRATDPVSVTPVFSADSQNIFFSSDRKGKRAIYRMRVERFVEQTGEDTDTN